MFYSELTRLVSLTKLGKTEMKKNRDGAQLFVLFSEENGCNKIFSLNFFPLMCLLIRVSKLHIPHLKLQLCWTMSSCGIKCIMRQA